MDDWPVDRDLDEKLRRIVNEEVAAADPRQIRLRPVVGAGRPWVRKGLALVAVVALIAVLAWRAQPAPPFVAEPDSPSAVPSLGSLESPTSTPTVAPTLAPPTPQASTAAPGRTLTPGVTPGPTADPAIRPSRKPECVGYLPVPLDDGRVLFTPGCTDLAPTLVFDPGTRMFTASGPMTTAPAFTRTTATRLRDGRVLFAGGVPATGSRLSTIDEIYDPSTGRFTPIGPFAPVNDAASVLLPDGRVLIVGSNWDTPLATDSAEVFDPTTNTIAATGPMLSGGNPVGSYFSAVLLGNGKVLVADSPNAQTARTQIYDPTTNSFKATKQSLENRDTSGFATALPDGRAMLFGGGNDIVEAYDPATDSFSRLASMPNGANLVSYARLTDGRILAIGEDRHKSSRQSASSGWFDLRPAPSSPVTAENATVPLILAVEIYDPATNKWTSLGDLSGARMAASCSVAPLPGGGAIILDTDTNLVELFDPKTGKFTVNQ